MPNHSITYLRLTKELDINHIVIYDYDKIDHVLSIGRSDHPCPNCKHYIVIVNNNQIKCINCNRVMLDRKSAFNNPEELT